MPNKDPRFAHIVARIAPGWGYWIDVGSGWYQIVLDLDADLAAIDPDYTLHQVKEKYGSLRYYAAHHPLDDREHDFKTCPFEQRIREAEALSAITCDVCGALGKVNEAGYWLRTRCDEHVGMRSQGVDPYR